MHMYINIYIEDFSCIRPWNYNHGFICSVLGLWAVYRQWRLALQIVQPPGTQADLVAPSQQEEIRTSSVCSVFWPPHTGPWRWEAPLDSIPDNVLLII